ncbi:DUF983 domain-containing protein [Tropicimonas sp. IMCC34011]|uniref:DUF983 domain-containing protein n=1 Tax=Tropicimonas sp. IMCC34011 TaxID=2248759 RepID=UPI000E22CBB7|nr:DUF983 domain-containing protein [Tropicimonas sp. IMCC34011]
MDLDHGTEQHPAAPERGGDDRPLGQSVLRGFRQRCPNCGEGKILFKYLKVRPACPVCGEDLSHQRADDGPAYVTILLVGHILGVVIHLVWVHLRPSPLMMALTLSAGVIVLSLWLLPRIKGAFVGLQWSRRMHGFGQGEPATD